MPNLRGEIKALKVYIDHGWKDRWGRIVATSQRLVDQLDVQDSAEGRLRGTLEDFLVWADACGRWRANPELFARVRTALAEFPLEEPRVPIEPVTDVLVAPDEVTHEPIRQGQAGTDVTEALTGVRLDLELCAVCSKNRGIGDHHITFRSAGGTEGPTMPTCVTCHDRIHDREWRLEIVERGLEIFDREGQLIWRLYAWPLAGDAGEFVQLLERVVEATKLMPEMASALLPWQASEVFRALRDLGEGGWKAQARLIGEWTTYRMPGLELQDKIPVICDLFGIRQSQAYNYVQVALAFAESDVLEQTELSMGYAIEASRTKDPVHWMRFAQERKLEHPQFNRQDMKEEIQRADARKYPPPVPEPGAASTSVVWAKCSECGAVNWHEKLPVGSDGKPVEVEEYADGE